MMENNDVCHEDVQLVFTTKWQRHFIEQARLKASMSKDTSTQCGCVLVDLNRNEVAFGYNGMVRGMDDAVSWRHQRPQKYAFFEHSERNALYGAARRGVATDGTVAFVTGPPCVDCTRGLIQAGIRAIFIPEYHNFRDQEVSDRWRESCRFSVQHINECGVMLRVVEKI